jgi:hypothetical protein
MIIYKRGAWLIPRLLASISPFSNVLFEDVVDGYGDHMEDLKLIKGAAASDNAWKIGNFAKELIASDDVREVQIRGHADRVWSHGTQLTADEDHVSQRRAEYAWDAVQEALRSQPGGAQILLKLMANEIGLIVVGMGTRQLLYTNWEDAHRNRRVQLQLWATRSVPV